MKLIVKKQAPLLAYLYENLDMPKKRIKKYLTNGSIYINNNKVVKYDYKLYPKMTITIDTNKNKRTFVFPIIYEDEHIIVINKPSSLLTIATSKEKQKTLYHMLRQYLNTTSHQKLFIIHRLDKDTSGLIMFAKDEKTKNMFQEKWNELILLREYIGIVHGTLEKKSGRIEQTLLETKTNLTYVSKNKEGKTAITNYKVLKENKNYSQLDINIETGRKNQIRVAFSSINHPLVGDKKYGFKDNKERLYLHANRLKIYYPYLKKELLFEISIPNEFKNIMKEK